MLAGVLIGGGTGFIGKRLVQHLKSAGYDTTVVSRMPGVKRITWHDLKAKGIPEGITAVVNLTGQNVLAGRWTCGFKQNVWNSRVNSTAALAQAISKKKEVETFVSISGVSHYKPAADKFYTEDDPVEEYDFMSKLCIEWEKAAILPPDTKCRHVRIRSGVVIGHGGGLVKSLVLPFWLGLGGPIGKGTQPFPWIHIDDLCRLIIYSIDNKNVHGILNGVAPEVVTNGEFSKTFASSLHRPAFMPLPESVVHIIFGKERSSLLLTGAKIKPKRTLGVGFIYDYPTAESACDEVVRRRY